ncbi:hypothetical protein II906_10610 [bacterium]|nr:hypothetical protein [bacterium]
MDLYRKKTNDPAIGYGAYHSCDYDDNFNCLKNIIYVDIPVASKLIAPDYKYQHDLSLAKTITHESTHALQFENGDYKEFMSPIAQNSGERAKQLNAIADIIFKDYESTMMPQMIQPFVDATELKNSSKYGITIPREIPMSQEIFLRKNKMDNASFDETVNQNFEETYSDIMYAINSGKAVVDDGVQALIDESRKSQEAQEKLKNDVRKTCYYRAKMEQEAYTAESELTRAVLKTKKSLNSDMFPVFYDLLAGALDKR